VFALTKPKLAVFTHVVQLASDHIPPPTLEDMLAETRQTYGGPLQIGEDLMGFEIGEVITVRRYSPVTPSWDHPRD
jgi:ribonuclease Z